MQMTSTVGKHDKAVEALVRLVQVFHVSAEVALLAALQVTQRTFEHEPRVDKFVFVQPRVGQVTFGADVTHEGHRVSVGFRHVILELEVGGEDERAPGALGLVVWLLVDIFTKVNANFVKTLLEIFARHGLARQMV